MPFRTLLRILTKQNVPSSTGFEPRRIQKQVLLAATQTMKKAFPKIKLPHRGNGRQWDTGAPASGST